MLDRVMDSYEFPTDLPDEDDRGALRWAGTAIATAAALLALLNAQSIRGWAEEFPPGPGVVKLVDATSAWEGVTDRLGLSIGHARLHKAWKRMESARWTKQAPVVEEARR